MERPKTIFCDIDGTLWNHIGGVVEQAINKTRHGRFGIVHRLFP